MNFRPGLAAVAAVLLLAGCKTDSEFTGKGAVVLSEYQRNFYDWWSNAPMTRDPLYFFLVSNGGAYAVVCPSSLALCRDSSERGSWQVCEDRYGEGTCKLYGVYGGVVWDFGAKPADGWKNDPSVKGAPSFIRGN